MAHILAARVGAMSTTTGTGSLAFSAALTAHRGFEDVLSNGSTTEYLVYAINTSGAASGQWEVGIGTYYNAGDAGGERLERTTVHETSENDTAKVNFSAGDKVVVISPLASRLMSIPTGGASDNLRGLRYDATASQVYWAGIPYRPVLPSPTPDDVLQIFVNAATGNDANTGFSSGSALETLDAAFSLLARYRAGNNGAKINLAAGNYQLAWFPSDPLDYFLNLEIAGAGVSSTNLRGVGCANGRVALTLSGLKVVDSISVANCTANSCTFDQTGQYGISYEQIVVMRPRDDLNQPYGRGKLNLNSCTFAGTSGVRMSLQSHCDGSQYGTIQAAGAASTSAVMLIGDHCTMIIDGGTGTSTGKRADVGHFSVIKTYGSGSGVEAFLPGNSAATFGHASAVV